MDGTINDPPSKADRAYDSDNVGETVPSLVSLLSVHWFAFPLKRRSRN